MKKKTILLQKDTQKKHTLILSVDNVFIDDVENPKSGRRKRDATGE